MGGAMYQLLTVSRLDRQDRYKHVDWVLRALVEVLSQIPVHLTIVGDGDDRRRLEGLSKSYGLGSAVTFLGTVSDPGLAALYAICDLFVLPSTEEGCGIVYLEAMKRGKVCLGADAGAVPELIQHNETGLLVPPYWSSWLAHEIVHILRDDVRRKRIGEAARQQYEQHFSYAAFKQAVEEALA